jgi:Ca2+-binding RTX toxin-like protein
LRGGEGDDVIRGGSGADDIYGDEGNDLVYGGTGDDYIRGGSGNDILYGEDDNDNINGGAGDDFLSGGFGDDVITDTSGVDRIFGGAGNDRITVAGGDWARFDRVDAGAGNDVIDVTGNKVFVSAGEGDDTIKTDLGKETVLNGGAGNDRFVVTGATYGSGPVASIYGGDSNAIIGSTFGFESIVPLDPPTDSGIDTLDLSQVSPDLGILTVRLGPATVNGQQVGNSIIDDAGVLLANLHGIENVDGSAQRDFIYGSSVDNVLDGGAGDDVLFGRLGNDTLIGGDGNDSLSGDEGDDRLFGGNGDDYLSGGADDDVLFGGNGNDRLLGGSGNDRLYGGNGNDTLLGGSGDDRLEGGRGADVMTGGAGIDTFVLTDAEKSSFTTTFRLPDGSVVTRTATFDVFDTITDFDTSGADHDFVDISTILVNQSNFYSTGTRFDAQAAFDRGYLYFVQHGTPGQADFGTYVMVDLNGGGHGDAANNFKVADLVGIGAAEVQNRTDLFLV